MKTTLISTIFNEEKTIRAFLQSIISQTELPNEVIIVDGGSTDQTLNVIKNYISQIKQKTLFRIYTKKGNRSVGRNEAIRKAKGDIILITDAGCLLDRNWIKEIIIPFADKSTDVVAGYYKAKSMTVFQKCLTPYVLVMPDRVNENDFLPATRSMAIRKNVFNDMGGFDVRYSHNEDYVFARKLKESGKKIVFARKAVVFWIPRTTFKQVYIMFRRFAFGDIEAGIVRDKVLLIFARYFLFLYLLFYTFLSRSVLDLSVLLLGGGLYIAYAIYKNYRYVQDPQALFLLPFLQLISDLAVMHGSTLALIHRIKPKQLLYSALSAKLTLFLVGLYLLITVPFVRWGVPSPSHPFFYFMDEWHGMQSVRYLFSTGSSNVEGAAYGMLFFYFLSGLFLIPFTIVGYINPFAITSTVGNLGMQEKVASVLRLSTIMWGVGSIFVLSKIVRKQIGTHPLLPLVLFTISPIWLALSTYFKYDIATVFWILLSIFSFFVYEKSPTIRNLVIVSIISGLTLTIKISALPVFGMLVVAFFLFTPTPFSKLKLLALSIGIFSLTVVLFGIPDITHHAIDYYNLLHLNIVSTADDSGFYRINGSLREYLIFQQFPQTFGIFLWVLSLGSAVFLFLVSSLIYIRKRIVLRKEIFLLVSFVFFSASLLTLRGIGAGSNRPLVLLPFLILFIALVQKIVCSLPLSKVVRYILIICCALGIGVQVIQSVSWLSLKYHADPRQTSSVWLTQNIKEHTIIGIENIPIYQMLPDTIVKDFYNQSGRFYYQYKIVDSKTPSLPKIVIMTNADSIGLAQNKSAKIDLLKRLEKEKYKAVVSFAQDLTFFKLIGGKQDLIWANLVAIPTTITVFEK